MGFQNGRYHRNRPSQNRFCCRTAAEKNLRCASWPYNRTREEAKLMERFDYVKVAPGAYRAMAGLEHYLHESGLEESLIHLIKLRASQINGCAYCIDMHWKDLKA